MAENEAGGPPEKKKHRNLSVTVDLPGVLVLLLIASFAMMAGTIGYGLATHQLKPATVLTVVGTVFSGVLAGALATWINNSNKKPPGDE